MKVIQFDLSDTLNKRTIITHLLHYPELKLVFSSKKSTFTIEKNSGNEVFIRRGEEDLLKDAPKVGDHIRDIIKSYGELISQISLRGVILSRS